MPYFETEFKKHDQVKFKDGLYDDEIGNVYVILDEPTDQSISTCAGDDLARVRVMNRRTLLDQSGTMTFKPWSTAFLNELELIPAEDRIA